MRSCIFTRLNHQETRSSVFVLLGLNFYFNTYLTGDFVNTVRVTLSVLSTVRCNPNFDRDKIKKFKIKWNGNILRKIIKSIDMTSKEMEKWNILYSLGLVCFPETGFRETIFQTFLCLFVIRKVGQRKTLSGQRKILSSQRKTLSGQRKILSSQF